MADIFISYANEDRSRAETIAKALEDKGWSVWWDRAIPPGKTFDIMIEEAINAASCVVVLWSKKSVKSDWVKEEANVGKERKILVPAKIDAIDPPFGFGRIQAADPTNWEKDSSHTGFVRFVNAISDIVQSRPPEETGGQVAAIPESDLGKQLEGQPEENKAPQPAAVADPEKKKTVKWAICVAFPNGPDNGKWRMTRGGSWTNQAAFLRSAKRLRQIPKTRLSYIGFRVARDP